MIPFHNLHALAVLFIVVACIQNAFGAYLSTPTRARLTQRRQPRDAHLSTRWTTGHEVP